METPVSKFECLACGYTDYRMSNKPEGELIFEGCPRCHGDMVVKGKDELPEKLEKIGESVEGHFQLLDFVISSDEMEFLVEEENQKEAFKKLLSNLEDLGYIAKMERGDEGLQISVRPAPEIKESNIMINIVLLLATIGTTFGVAGYWYLYGNVLEAALFSSSLLTILGAHELAHKASSWKYGVEASWPYFIPVPIPLIGTLGAVIKNKSPIPSKEALVSIGASGPIIGFIFAVPITILGFSFPQNTGSFLQGIEGIFQVIPTPLILLAIGKFFGYNITTLSPHPLVWAGFIGFLVTWLNLLPTGQLDGGHVARSFLSQENHFLLTRIIGFTLLFLGLFIWPAFLIFGLLILFLIGKPHPGALDNVSDLAGGQKTLAFVTMFVFILTLPIPLWMI